MEEFELSVPVVFFTYIRLETAQQVFEEIRKAKPKRLYHISDHAKELNKQDKVEAVIKYINDHIDWPCQVYRDYAEENYGCRRRINTGLDWVFENEESAIILEDDVVPTQSFFRFCQEMLNLYKDESSVFMITGNKSVEQYETVDDYIFSRYCDIWGWATWRRAWAQNDKELCCWEKAKRDKILEKIYGEEVCMNFTRNLDLVYEGELNTWDYPWLLSKAMCGGLQIVPRNNLVRNIGMLSEDATHHFDKEITMTLNEMDFPLKVRDAIFVDEKYDSAYAYDRYHICFIEKLIRRHIPAKWLRNLRKFFGIK